MFYAEWFYSFYFAPVLVKNILIMGMIYLFFRLDREDIKRLYYSIRKRPEKGAMHE
jgi:hypothetical protein